MQSHRERERARVTDSPLRSADTSGSKGRARSGKAAAGDTAADAPQPEAGRPEAAGAAGLPRFLGPAGSGARAATPPLSLAPLPPGPLVPREGRSPVPDGIDVPDPDPEAEQPGQARPPQRPGLRAAQRPGGKAGADEKPVAPAVGRARVRTRHYGLVLSFFLVVVVPAMATGWYLWARAADQYTSSVGFSVRREEAQSAVELLGGLSKMSGSSSSDTDILYEFIRSQELVRLIDAEMDLRGHYSAPYDRDPVFAFNPEGTIEDLMAYWRRMVKTYYDPGTGLIELRVHAFDPAYARDLAQRIFVESTRMINELSDIARDDATRYAQAELERAIERLKIARQAVTEFRMRTQIVDPSADIQGKMGLLANLQNQLAAALIELDLLRDVARDGDPRIAQAERRIEVIERRIAEERRKFGVGGEGPGGEDYATLVAEFERLTVDRQFAEQAYTAALSAYDAALSDAQRQSRYLAAYIRPTLAERSAYPERPIVLALTAFFLLLAWSIAVLIYYSIRDRR
jgi:capsular polysaccharide transport system permease protein